MVTSGINSFQYWMLAFISVVIAVVLWLANQFLSVVAKDLLKEPGETFAKMIRKGPRHLWQTLIASRDELHVSRNPAIRTVSFWVGYVLVLFAYCEILSGKIFGYTATNVQTAWMNASQIVPLFLTTLLVAPRWPATPMESSRSVVLSGCLMASFSALIATALGFIPIALMALAGWPVD
jgi:hypothetical protein